MKTLSSLMLILCGLTGAAVSFLSNIMVNSTISLINGRDLSMWLGLFFIFAFLSGLYYLFLTN
jgi:hypothetical protein